MGKRNASVAKFASDTSSGDFVLNTTDNPIQAAYIACDKRESLFDGGVGSGKGFHPDTQVVTPFGLRRVGDIKEGNTVCNPDGCKALVVGVYKRGAQPFYRITFRDGDVIECDADHLWPCWKAEKKGGKRDVPYRIIPTRTLYEWFKADYTIQMPVSKAVCFTAGRRVPIPVDPYTLGVLIGDGSFGEEAVGLTCADAEIVAKIPYQVNGRKDPISFGLPGFLPKIKKLGLNFHRSWEKFIPQTYLFLPIPQRWELLRGLMDTDGTCSKSGCISYCTTSPQLAKDVKFLVQSLGGLATISEAKKHYRYKGKKKRGRLAFILYIKLPDPSQAFSLARKKGRCRKPQHVQRAIVKIERIENKESICLAVDHPNQLFLVENCIVTHNTVGALVKLLSLAEKFPAPSGSLPADFTKTLTRQRENPSRLFARGDGLSATFSTKRNCSTARKSFGLTWTSGTSRV